MRCWLDHSLDNTIDALKHYSENRENIFSAEEIEGLSALGGVLKQIRIRLKKEGFIIRDGKLYKESDIINTYDEGKNTQ